MSKELMRRAIIDMILWTDSEKKIKIIFWYLSSLLKKVNTPLPDGHLNRPSQTP